MLKNKNVAAGIILAGWIIVWVMIFIVGNTLESLLLFILFYNLVYPAYTAVGCYLLAKKKGIVWYVPITMNIVTILFFVATELVKFALPNAIVVTIVTTFFATGIGKVMYGNDNKKK